MLILKEDLGKSAEHWKNIRKNKDLSPGLSLLLSLDLCLLIAWEKKTNMLKKTTETKIKK